MSDSYVRSNSEPLKYFRPLPQIIHEQDFLPSTTLAYRQSDLPRHQDQQLQITALKKQNSSHWSVDSNYDINEFQSRRKRSTCPPNMAPYKPSNFKQIESQPSQARKISPLISIKLYKTAAIYQALMHQKASVFKDTVGHGDNLCECCGEPISGSKIPITCSLKKLAPLGPSIPMLFVLIKHLALILLVMFGSYFLISISILIIQDEFALDSVLFPLFSGGPKSELFWVHYVSLTLGFLAYLTLRKEMNLLSVKYLRGYQDISSYSVMLDQLSLEDSYHKIQQAFQQLNIKQIAFTYDIKELISLSKKYDKLLRYQRKWQNGERKNFFFRNTSQQELDSKIEDIESRLYQMVTNFNYENLAPVAFVSFQTKLEAQIALKQLNRNTLFSIFCNKNQNFRIRKAVSPDELHWQNFSLSLVSKYRILTFHFLLELFLIGIITSSIFWIRLRILDEIQDEGMLEVNLYQLATNSFILLMELFYTWLVYRKAIKERYKTESHYKMSISIRILLLLSLNSGLIIFIIFYFKSPYQWNGFDGFANQIVNMLVINATVVPLYHLYPLDDIIKNIRIKFIKAKNSFSMSQIELNQIFDPPAILIQTRYAQIMKTFYITLLFMVVAPVGVPITAGGLLLYYWLMKYKLLRINKKPEHISQEMGLLFCSAGQIGFFLYALGTALVYEHYGEPNRIIVIYSIFLIFLVNIPVVKKRMLNLKIDHLVKIYRDDQEDFENLKIKIKQDYISENPIEKFKSGPDEGLDENIINIEAEILAKISQYTQRRVFSRQRQQTLPRQLRMHRTGDRRSTHRRSTEFGTLMSSKNFYN